MNSLEKYCLPRPCRPVLILNTVLLIHLYFHQNKPWYCVIWCCHLDHRYNNLKIKLHRIIHIGSRSWALFYWKLFIIRKIHSFLQLPFSAWERSGSCFVCGELGNNWVTHPQSSLIGDRCLLLKLSGISKARYTNWSHTDLYLMGISNKTHTHATVNAPVSSNTMYSANR